MARMATQTPTRKVVSSSLSAPISILLIWVAETTIGIDIPQSVEAAILTILVFATGYFTPPSSFDRLKETA